MLGRVFLLVCFVSIGTCHLENFSQTSPGPSQLETFSQTSLALVTLEKCEECAKRAECTCQLETFSQTSPALVTPEKCEECAKRAKCTCQLETFSQTSPALVTPVKCEECAKRAKCTCQLETFSQTSPALVTLEKCEECAKRGECTCQLETFSQTSPALVTPVMCEECAKRGECTCLLETFSQTSPALVIPEKCEECAKRAECTCQLETFSQTSPAAVTPEKCEKCAKREKCTSQLETFSQTSPALVTPEKCEECVKRAKCTCHLETFSQTSPALVTPEKCEECAKRAECTCQLETFSQTSPAFVTPEMCEECTKRAKCACQLETFSQTSPALVIPEKCEECAKRTECTCQLETFSQTSPAFVTPEKCEECTKRAKCTCQLETFSQTSPALVTPEKCEECAKRAKCTCQLETFSQTSPALVSPSKCEDCARRSTCTCQLETFSQTSPALVTPEKCEECARRSTCTCQLETFSQTSPALVTTEKCEECARRSTCTCQLETFSQTSPALVSPGKCEVCARRSTCTCQLETFSQTSPEESFVPSTCQLETFSQTSPDIMQQGEGEQAVLSVVTQAPSEEPAAAINVHVNVQVRSSFDSAGFLEEVKRQITTAMEQAGWSNNLALEAPPAGQASDQASDQIRRTPSPNVDTQQDRWVEENDLLLRAAEDELPLEEFKRQIHHPWKSSACFKIAESVTEEFQLDVSPHVSRNPFEENSYIQCYFDQAMENKLVTCVSRRDLKHGRHFSKTNSDCHFERNIHIEVYKRYFKTKIGESFPVAIKNMMAMTKYSLRNYDKTHFAQDIQATSSWFKKSYPCRYVLLLEKHTYNEKSTHRFRHWHARSVRRLYSLPKHQKSRHSVIEISRILRSVFCKVESFINYEKSLKTKSNCNILFHDTQLAVYQKRFIRKLDSLYIGISVAKVNMKKFEVLSELECSRSYPGPEREEHSERLGYSFGFHYDRTCLKGNISSKKSSKELTLMFDSQTVKHSFPIERPRKITNKENAFNEASAKWTASHKGSPVSIFLSSSESDFITELLHYTTTRQVCVNAHGKETQRLSVQIKSVDRPEVHLKPSNQGSHNPLTPALTPACFLRDGYHKKGYMKQCVRQDATSTLPMQKSRERTTEQLNLSIKINPIPCQQWKEILELDTTTKSSDLQLLHSIEAKLSCIYFSRYKALLGLGKVHASPQEKKQESCRNVTKITKTKSKLNSADCRSLPKGLKVFNISSLKMMMAGDFVECSNQKNNVEDMAVNEGEDSTHGTVVVTRRRRIKRLICLVHTGASYSKHEHSRISKELGNNRQLSEDQSDNLSHHFIKMKLVNSEHRRALHKVHEKYNGKKLNWARHDDEVGTRNKDDGNMKENLICMNDPINIDDNTCKHLTSLGAEFVDGLKSCSIRGNTQDKPEDTRIVASLERTSTTQVAVSSLAQGTKNEASKQEKTDTLSETVCRIHVQKYVKSIVERAWQMIRKHKDTHLLPDNDAPKTVNASCALCKCYSQSLDRTTHKLDEERFHGVAHQSTINKRIQDGLDVSIVRESVEIIAKDCGLRNGRTEQAPKAFADRPVHVQAPDSGKQSDHQVRPTSFQDCTSISSYMSMVVNIARTKVQLLEESAAQPDSKNEFESIRASQSEKSKARLKMQSLFSNESWLDFLLKEDSENLLQEKESTITKTCLLNDKYDKGKEFRKYEKALRNEQETSQTNRKVAPLSTSLEAGISWYTSSALNECHQESSDDSDLSDVILSIEYVDSSTAIQHAPNANALVEEMQVNTYLPSPQNSSVYHAHEQATESVSFTGFSYAGIIEAGHDFSSERQTIHSKTDIIALSPPKESNLSLNRFENDESSYSESLIFVIKTVAAIDTPRDFSSGSVPTKNKRECSSCTKEIALLQVTGEALVNRKTVDNADIKVADELRQTLCTVEKQPEDRYLRIHSSNGVKMTAQSNGQIFSEPGEKIYTNSNLSVDSNTHPVELLLNDHLFAGNVGNDSKGPLCLRNDAVVSADDWSLPLTESVHDPYLTVRIKPRDNGSILQEAFKKLLETIVTTCEVLPQLWVLDISCPDQLYCAETVKSSDNADDTSKMWMIKKGLPQSDLQFITVVSPERGQNLTDDHYDGRSLLLFDSDLDKSSRSSLLCTSPMSDNTASSEEADCFYSRLSGETAGLPLGNVKKVQDDFEKAFLQQEEQQYKLNLLSENMSAAESWDSLSATAAEMSLPMQKYCSWDIEIISEQSNEIKEEVLEYPIEFNEESTYDEDMNVQIHLKYHQNAKKDDERSLEIKNLHTRLLFPYSSTAVKDESEDKFDSSTSEVSLYNECQGLKVVSDSSMLEFCAHQCGLLSAYSSQSMTSQCCVDIMSSGQTSATACDQRVHTVREGECRQEGWRETSRLSACRSCSCSPPTVRDCSKCSVSDTWTGRARRSGLLTELIEDQLKEWPVSDTEIEYDSYVYTYRPGSSNRDCSLKVSNKPEITQDSPVCVPANSRGEGLDTVGAPSTSSFTDMGINTTGYEFNNNVAKVFQKSMFKSPEGTCNNLSSYTAFSFTNSKLFIDTAFWRRNTHHDLCLEKDNSLIDKNPIGKSVNAFEEDDKRTTCKISNIECSTDKDLQSASLSNNGVNALRSLCSVSNGSSNILYSCKGCSNTGPCYMSVNSQTFSVNSHLGFKGELPLHNGITSLVCGLKRVSSVLLSEEESCFIMENKELLDLSVSKNSGLTEGSDYSYAERKDGSFQNGDFGKKEIMQNDQNNRDKISTDHVFEESCLDTISDDMHNLTASGSIRYNLFAETPSRENVLVPNLEVTFHGRGFVSREEYLALKEIGLEHVLSQSDQISSYTNSQSP